jgi:hypothetical protein
MRRSAMVAFIDSAGEILRERVRYPKVGRSPQTSVQPFKGCG